MLLFTGCLHTRLPEAKILQGPSDEGPLHWRRAVEIALRDHPDLIEARQSLQSKKHNRNQTIADFLPSADGSLTRSRSRTTGTRPMEDDLDLGLSVDQTFFSGFENTADFLKAKREWEAERWAYFEKSAEIRLSLRSAYIATMEEYQLLAVTREIAKRRRENAELIRMRYEAGRENKGAMLRAKAIADQAEFNVRQSERQIEQKSLALGRHLGGHFSEAIRVEENLEPLLPEKTEKPGNYPNLAESVPSVQRLIKNAEALKAGIAVSQSGLWPDVTGSFDYGYSGVRSSEMRDDASLRLRVDLPLFRGGETVLGILEANADYRAAFETARSARDEAITDLSSAWIDFRDALEAVDVRRAFLEAARERAGIVRSQYSSGLVNFQDFDIAEQELADSERNYVTSLADALRRQAGWEGARGLTLEEALNEK